MVETENQIQLFVPEREARRAEITLAARKIVARHNVLPPVSFQTLENFGHEVLQEVNGNPVELAFAMLMCSNELWRPYFEATPFSRRLLLMPQCLKNSKSCTAIIDDLGLICAACNKCNINTFLNDAENIGYHTLVAEGSTSAIALVEEGSVDAILGVSCMEVLQKSFKHVLTSAIPSIAVPLLSNGCTDTQVDPNCLGNEIKAYSQAILYEPLSVSLMKQHTQSLYTEEFLLKHFAGSSSPSKTDLLAIEAILKGGKRMRPLLAYMAYGAYATEFQQSMADQIMLMVECFHKASLIHDDIEDNDEYRYGKKTIHAEHGVPIAINLGDYLIGQGYQIASNLAVEAEPKLEIFKMLSSMHLQSTIGQGEELLSMKKGKVFNYTETMQVFKQKTGSAIKVSLLVGAIAANAPKADVDILSNFSDMFGIAYQIRDDLTEYKGEATDQETASFPLLKSVLLEKIVVTPESPEQWRKLIAENGIENIVEQQLEESLNNIRSLLNGLSSHKLRLALLAVVNKIFK